MSILSVVGDIVKPVANLIDELHTSGEEKGQIQTELNKLTQSFGEKLLEYEQSVLTLRSNIIVAEAQGQSWLQRSWRPITMLTFLVLVVFDAFGVLPFRLAAEAWTLLQLGLGGYVVGRSAEKIVPQVITAMQDNKAKKG